MELHRLNARTLQADGAIGIWLKQGVVDADPCDQTYQLWPLITLFFVDTLASRPLGW